MKIALLILVAAAVLAVGFGIYFFRTVLAGGSQEPQHAGEGVLWDLQTQTLAGEPIGLDTWRGQVALVVNVASKCGLTPQYKGFESLYREFSAAGFVVIGYPCNDFLGQEPGTPEEIREFCSAEYDITFPLMHKVTLKGDDMYHVYRFLTQSGLDAPSWNFTKYLVGRDGAVVARFGPKTKADDAELRAAIEKALAVER